MKNDGNQIFTPHTITADANQPTSVFAIDVDGDGDIDVFSASFDDDKITWYANDGDENFMPRIITTDANGASSVYAADVDGDGDVDVLSASINDNKIAWYENIASPVTGVNFNVPGVPQQFILHNNYPNPFNPATTITYDLPEAANVVLKIYTVLGREVRTLIYSRQQPGPQSVVWDGRNARGMKVSSGIFIYRLQAGDLVQAKKMILLK